MEINTASTAENVFQLNSTQVSIDHGAHGQVHLHAEIGETRPGLIQMLLPQTQSHSLQSLAQRSDFPVFNYFWMLQGKRWTF